jgi:hypothetical protein
MFGHPKDASGARHILTSAETSTLTTVWLITVSFISRNINIINGEGVASQFGFSASPLAKAKPRLARHTPQFGVYAETSENLANTTVCVDSAVKAVILP